MALSRIRRILRSLALQLLRLGGRAWLATKDNLVLLIALASIASIGVGLWWIYPPLALIGVPILVLGDLINAATRA